MDRVKSKRCDVCGRVISTGYPYFKHMEYHIKRKQAEQAYDENGKFIGYKPASSVKDTSIGPLFEQEEK